MSGDGCERQQQLRAETHLVTANFVAAAAAVAVAAVAAAAAMPRRHRARATALPRPLSSFEYRIRVGARSRKRVSEQALACCSQEFQPLDESSFCKRQKRAATQWRLFASVRHLATALKATHKRRQDREHKPPPPPSPPWLSLAGQLRPRISRRIVLEVARSKRHRRPRRRGSSVGIDLVALTPRRACWSCCLLEPPRIRSAPLSRLQQR